MNRTLSAHDRRMTIRAKAMFAAKVLALTAALILAAFIAQIGPQP